MNDITRRVLQGFAELSIASELTDPDQDVPFKVEVIGSLLDFYNKAEANRSWLKIMWDHGPYLSIKRRYENTPTNTVVYAFRFMANKPVNGQWIKRADGVFPIKYAFHKGTFAGVVAQQLTERGHMVRDEYLNKEPHPTIKKITAFRGRLLKCPMIKFFGRGR